MGNVIELGCTVVDRATGYKGTATARAVYLSGSPRIMVEGLSLDSGGVFETWFDEGRLDVVPAAVA